MSTDRDDVTIDELNALEAVIHHLRTAKDALVNVVLSICGAAEPFYNKKKNALFEKDNMYSNCDTVLQQTTTYTDLLLYNSVTM